MKVTPLDLRQQRFNAVMRGYDRGEVSAFLNEVADDYENALREADRLRQEVVKLEAMLAEHRGQERNLRNTLLTAQKMADEVKDQATAEAERVIKEAESRADLIVQKSQGRIEDVQREIEGIAGETNSRKDAKAQRKAPEKSGRLCVFAPLREKLHQFFCANAARATSLSSK